MPSIALWLALREALHYRVSTLCQIFLVAALAAGNIAIVKPSELASNTAAAIMRIIGGAFAREQVAVVDVSQLLLASLDRGTITLPAKGTAVFN